MIDVLIIMNNYFHDVATAVLIAAAVIMWVLSKGASEGGSQEMAALARAYPKLRIFAWISLIWIVVGGVPRLIFFNTHDLGAVFDDLAVAIAVKHIFEFAAVAAGVVMWRRTRRLIEGSSHTL